MNTLEISDNWNVTRRNLKQKWIKLTSDDLPHIECGHDDLVLRIQHRTGECREAVEDAIMECFSCGD